VKFGVVVFPGSNCDIDCFHILKTVLKKDVEYVWHQEKNIDTFDCIVLPGGFSYGDYLRCGAVARFSPVMEAVVEHANKGKLVIGICNGFQILTEAGLLPGALIRNKGLKFICDTVELKIENNSTPFTNKAKEGQIIEVPIAHGEGNYVVDEDTLKEMEQNNQIIFRYISNPNGSVSNIAGVCNKEKNVLGMMPHPERCGEKILGNDQGLVIFESIIKHLEEVAQDAR
jgi:phosphoribosylformylglycinamidine synthase subunit PurQ / glutaminase